MRNVPGAHRFAGGLLLMALTLISAACIPGRSDDETQTVPDPAAADAGLTITPIENPVVCDGTSHPAVTIMGALPFEPIVFAAPEGTQVPAAVAGDDGSYTLNWTCSPELGGTAWDLTATGESSGRSAMFTVQSGAAPAQFVVNNLAETVLCDGNPQSIGTLSGAGPQENVTFSANPIANITPALADELGSVPLTWQCSPTEADTMWTVTATGQVSGLTATYSFTGQSTGAEGSDLVATITENPFLCDGAGRQFGVITGFDPSEPVDFASPQASGLRQGTAGADGTLPINWQCGPDGAGKTWDLTATGQNSGKTVTVSFTGAAGPTTTAPATTAPATTAETPESTDAPATTVGPVPEGDPVATITENPFICDDAVRQFATITGFAPGEMVSFTSPQASDIAAGTVDAEGTLPINWQCGADGIAKTWELTATGQTSQKTITISFTGAAPGG